MSDLPNHATTGAYDTEAETLTITCECDWSFTTSTADGKLVIAMNRCASAGLEHILDVLRRQLGGGLDK